MMTYEEWQTEFDKPVWMIPELHREQILKEVREEIARREKAKKWN